MFHSTLATHLAQLCSWTMITCTIQISHFREKKIMKFGVLRGYVFAVWHFWCEGRCQLEGVFFCWFFLSLMCS